MKKNIILAGMSLIICFVLLEISMELAGRHPGQIRFSQWFNRVEKVVPVDGFTTDENGIFKVDTAVVARVERLFIERTDTDFGFNWKTANVVPEVGIVALQPYAKNETTSGQNELKRKLSSIGSRQKMDCFDSLLVAYFNQPINADGFYSIPFDANCTDRKRILLLGDSFTWGHSTIDKTSSFANTLLARGYLVFNTGISGTDPAQYRKILETYIDELEPDIVIVNFYIGNDVEYFERVPTKETPILYNTNAGNLNTFQYGVQYSGLEQTYEMVLKHMSIPQTNLRNRIASKTALGTLIWDVAVKRRILHPHFEDMLPVPDTPFCNREIERIQGLCESKGIDFILSVIPNLNGNKLEGVETVPNLFRGLEYQTPQMTTDMYVQTDGHFNESGHLFYANFIENLIRE